MTFDAASGAFVMQLQEDLTTTLRTGCQWTGYFCIRQHLMMTAILYPRTSLLVGDAQGCLHSQPQL